MPNHSSAEKRVRQIKKITAQNRTRRSKIRSSIKGFKLSLAEGNREEAEQKLVIACRQIRQAASNGVIHKVNASRSVSRLVAQWNSSSASA